MRAVAMRRVVVTEFVSLDGVMEAPHEWTGQYRNEAWPDVPTKFLLCRDDRFFPADFMRRVVRERLSITPDEIDGGHLVALSRPKELADRLEEYRPT